MKRILVTFAGGHLAHGVCMALRAAPEPVYIVGTDSSKFHLHQAEANETHLVPRGNEPDYAEILSQIIEEANVDFVWPMHDDEVESVAKIAHLLPARTWLPPIDVINISRDKLATNQCLKAAGVPAPNTVLIETPEDLESALERFNGEVWLRANTGAGSKGAFKTSDLAEARWWLDKQEGWGSFTAAELLPGEGQYTQDLIWKNGKLVACQFQTRLIQGRTNMAQRGPVGRGVQQADAPDEVNTITQAAVRAVMPEPDGLFRVDMTTDRDGVPNVTEVDAGRFSSGGPVNWHHLGYNLAYTALRLAFHEPLDHDTPVMNPYPKDYVAIGGRNRPQVFLSVSQADEKEQELVNRRAK